MKVRASKMYKFGIVLMLAIVVSLCLLSLIWYDGYFLPHKPCRPISYPNGEKPWLKPGQSYFHSTNDSVDKVLQFYTNRLIKVDEDGIFWWELEQLEEFKYLYKCAATDLNGLTIESGCIFVSQNEDVTLIETILYRSDTVTRPCRVEEWYEAQ